jgi:hypothetical protein
LRTIPVKHKGAKAEHGSKRQLPRSRSHEVVAIDL